MASFTGIQNVMHYSDAHLQLSYSSVIYKMVPCLAFFFTKHTFSSPWNTEQIFRWPITWTNLLWLMYDRSVTMYPKAHADHCINWDALARTELSLGVAHCINFYSLCFLVRRYSEMLQQREEWRFEMNPTAKEKQCCPFGTRNGGIGGIATNSTIIAQALRYTSPQLVVCNIDYDLVSASVIALIREQVELRNRASRKCLRL